MKKIILLLAVTATIGFWSCEDYLDRPPLDRIGNDSYWSTPTDFMNYTLQFYSKFPSFGGGAANYTGIFGYDAFNGSDHAITGTIPNSTLNGTNTLLATNSNWNWSNIRSINIFFENLAKTNVPLSDIKHFIGEAHFFKAWFYFEKVQTFGDVPWFTNTLQMNSEELYRPRDSRNIVVDSILFHLDKAIENLSKLSDMTSLGGSNRLSKEAALAFKSRVALFEGTWEKYHNGTAFGVPNADWNKYFRIAVEAAEELMNGNYKVGIYNKSKPAEDYAYVFSQEDFSSVNEIILWKQFSVDLGLGNQFQPFVSGFTATIGLTENLARNYLSKNGEPINYDELISTQKGRAFLIALGDAVDARLSQTIWIPGALLSDNIHNVNGQPKYFSNPALNQSGNGFNGTGFQMRKGVNPYSATAGGPTTTQGNTGGIIFRFAEVLLNYAEAKAELGEPVDYNKSLNILRRRAGMPNFNKDNVDPNRSSYADFGYTLTNELYEIRRERAVELATEGFRTMDLFRWAGHNLIKGKRPKGYPFSQTDWGTTKINIPIDESGRLDPLKKGLPSGYGFNPNRDYLDYIPINEITLNSKLEQNPGWE